MKNDLILIALAISLMSTKCADETLNIDFNNKSDKNVIFSFTKNTDTLKKVILKNFNHDNRFKYLKSKNIKNDVLGNSDLYFYSKKGKSFYTFYFLRVVKFDTVENNYVFEKKYDSINIVKEKIFTGEKANNTFIYDNKKIVFKSHK